MLKYFNSILNINLEAIVSNYNYIKSLAPTAECSAVVKANAYGLGILEVSRALINMGRCSSFFVANLDDGLKLCNFKNINIYVLHGITNNEQAALCANNNLTPVLNSIEQIKLYNDYGIFNEVRLPAIINLETGMGRLGLQNEEWEKLCATPNLLSNIELKYIMSHLACASDKENPRNNLQRETLEQMLKQYKQAKVSLVNSSGIFLGSQYHYHLLRPGYALWGGNPTQDRDNQIRTVVTLEAFVLQKKILQKNQGIGYNATFEGKVGDKILIVEMGYGDGYSRAFSNIGYGIYNGKRLNVAGIVSMDLVIVEANALDENEFNEIKYVEFLGEHISVDEAARGVKTIGYEILTSLGNNYKRVYNK